MNFNSTEELTRQLVRGDPAAIAAYYEQYFDLMFQEAKQASGADEATCLDLVQDAMLKMLRTIKAISTSAQLEYWTRRLVRSVTLDHYRKLSRRRKRELKAGRSQPELNSQSQYDLAEARRIWLEECMEKMDQEARQLLNLRYQKGWTLARIGKVVGLKTGTVDRRIRKIVDQLRQQAEVITHE